MSTSESELPPFHRLLSFYSNRSPYPDTQTIRLYDSLTGNLSLGLDFPVALAVAIGRHLTLRNTPSFFSLDIHVPSVPRTQTPLEGIPIDQRKDYSRTEFLNHTRTNAQRATALAGGGGFLTSVLVQVEALGLWSLAADAHDGRLSGADVAAFQQGTLFDEIAQRRKDREEVLPLLRGGPIWIYGHSWAVAKFFDVSVYQATKGKKE